ncbi:MAG: hypothetical protein DMG58_29545 [Acidobacteria bacterium]|nr:MAG: hypothetical protein DMG58_29545 [Acidobacteriota bacterium]
MLQGMSGSPVYIGGKLVGAVAMAFPFSKEPIAVIRPIEDMVRVSGAPSESLRRAKVSLESTNLTAMLPKPEVALSGEMRMVDIATPVWFGGFTRATIEQFAPTTARARPGATARGIGGRAGRGPQGRSLCPATRFNDQRGPDERRPEHRCRRHRHPHRSGQNIRFWPQVSCDRPD